MKVYGAFQFVVSLFLYGFSIASASPSDVSIQECKIKNVPNVHPPFVEPRIFRQGTVQIIPKRTTDSDGDSNQVEEFPTSSVLGCCSKVPIGEMPQLSTEQATDILDDAVTKGWKGGAGDWTQMSLSERIERVQDFVRNLQSRREAIIDVLMWEIGKNYKDAASEFDRTIQFIEMTIDTIQSLDIFNPDAAIKDYGSSTHAFVRRNAIGIILCLGPYNYPLNEAYATLIPALLMGNVVIFKIPSIGGLSHLLTFDAFTKALPPNTIHFISGSGRKTLPSLMESGKIDALAFIGGSNAADRLIKYHPHPHRLKIFLQLEAKNMAIMHKNLFDNSSQDDGNDDLYNLDKALDDIITGALSFNGQRCTALKIIMVPEGRGEYVAKELSKRVQSLRIGLPWQTFGDDNSLYSQITPLPTDGRIAVMNVFIEDALSKGSSIINPNGGATLDLADPASSSVISKSNLMVPTVLFPVKPDMELYREEQFGPIIPVTEYNPATFEEVLTFAHEGKYGQQVSIFTKSNSNDEITYLVDQLSPVFGKINLNSQCGRSPDILPFSARKSSGLGVMSVEDALREFSIPTVVAFKTGKDSRIESTVEEIQDKSNFMKSIKR